MLKPNIITKIFIALSVFTLSGCFGLVVAIPEECEMVYPDERFIYGKKQIARKLSDDYVLELPFSMVKISQPNSPITKEDFTEMHGPPDEVIENSEGLETWIYRKKLWCGVVPAFVIPLPLVLPVCDGFEQISFEGDEANYVHFRRTEVIGGLIPGAGFDGISCPNQIEARKLPTYLDENDIPEDAGIVILYRKSSFLGGAVPHDIYTDEDFIFTLYNGIYYRYSSAIGERKFRIDSHLSNKFFKIAIRPKQKHYVRFSIGFFKSFLEEMPAEVAEKEIAGIRLAAPPTDTD